MVTVILLLVVIYFFLSYQDKDVKNNTYRLKQLSQEFVKIEGGADKR
jgi:hypothetical protein